MAAIVNGRQRGTSIYPELGKWIDGKGLTLTEFGAMVDTSQTTMSKILLGNQEPGRILIEKICATTGLTCVITPDGMDFVSAYHPKSEEKDESGVIDIPVHDKVQAEAAANTVVDIVKETAGAIIEEVMKVTNEMKDNARKVNYSFDEFAAEVSKSPVQSKQYTYLTLGSATGNLNEIQRLEYIGKKAAPEDVAKEVGALLWCASRICDTYGIDISGVAFDVAKNIRDGLNGNAKKDMKAV